MSAITAVYTFSGVGEDFGPRADGIVTLHTTESVATRNTVADARLVAAWQDRSDILGSYNRLICTDGILSTVPDDHASGGMNPSSNGFKPRAWLYDFLDADEIANPNYFSLQLAAVGQKAYFDANGWPPQIIDGMARSIIDEERRIKRGVVVTNHADFQPPPNRSDAGQICIDLVMARYAQLKALPDTAQEDEMTWVNQVAWYKTPVLVTFRPGTTYRLTPTLDDTGIYVSGVEEKRTVIGEVNGVDFGAGPKWLVIPGDGGVPKVAHSQDETARVPLADVTALQAKVLTAEQTIADFRARLGQINGLSKV